MLGLRSGLFIGMTNPGSPPSPPVFSVDPSISGDPTEGETLTGDPGTHDGTSETYAWEADGTPISGETGTTLVLTSDEVGADITFVVTATNAGGDTVAESDPVGPVEASGPGAHTYWRIFITDNHGDASFVDIQEIQMRATPGGADQCSGGTAFASSFTGGAPASGAFDNSTGYWLSASGSVSNQHIGYQFASPVEVVEVSLAMQNSDVARFPKNCKLQYSDNGTDYTDAFTFYCGAWVLQQTRVFPEAAPAAGFHRAWRIYCLNNNGDGSWVGLDEVEFRATSGGADQVPAMVVDTTTSGRAIADAFGAGANPYKAFDNTTGIWLVTYAASPHWVGFVFPSAVKVEEVLLKGTSTAARSPNDIRIEYSDDEVTWTSQKAINDLTWSAGESKVLAAI